MGCYPLPQRAEDLMQRLLVEGVRAISGGPSNKRLLLTRIREGSVRGTRLAARTQRRPRCRAAEPRSR